MYGIKYYAQGGQIGYLAINKKGEYTIKESIANIAEFDDKYEAIDAAVETSKKIYGNIVDFSLMWRP